MPPRQTRSAGRSRDAEPAGADSPPDAKHYAIMGSLLVGPPLLVIILFVALSGGGDGTDPYADGPVDDGPKGTVQGMTPREKQDLEDAKKVDRLLKEAAELHESAKYERRRFYQKEEEQAKMAAFKEAKRILEEAKSKVDEAYNLDRRGAKQTEIQDLQQAIQQDLHNIMKDKPVYVE